MNVNEKGAFGLIKVIEALYTEGWHAFLPFDDYSPVDLIAVKGDKIIRLQVKYRQRNKRNQYSVEDRSSVNGKTVKIDKTLIDGWAVYLREENKVVFVNKSLFDNQSGLCVELKHHSNIEDWKVN